MFSASIFCSHFNICFEYLLLYWSLISYRENMYKMRITDYLRENVKKCQIFKFFFFNFFAGIFLRFIRCSVGKCEKIFYLQIKYILCYYYYVWNPELWYTYGSPRDLNLLFSWDGLSQIWIGQSQSKTQKLNYFTGSKFNPYSLWFFFSFQYYWEAFVRN